MTVQIPVYSGLRAIFSPLCHPDPAAASPDNEQIPLPAPGYGSSDPAPPAGSFCVRLPAFGSKIS